MLKKSLDSIESKHSLSETPSHQVIDLRDAGNWKEQPEVTFDQSAALKIAQWVLGIFAGVYTLAFLLGFAGLFLEGATFEKLTEFIQFMLTSVIPIVTLAVGYYLGQKGAGSD